MTDDEFLALRNRMALLADELLQGPLARGLLRRSKRREFDRLTKVYNRCRDCGGKPGAYMVTNELWLEAVPDAKRTAVTGNLGGGHLCLACLEKRLSRPLDAAEIADCGGRPRSG
jgi:hypothetical protein